MGCCNNEGEEERMNGNETAIASMIPIVNPHNCPIEYEWVTIIIVDTPSTYQKIDPDQQNLQRQENGAHWSSYGVCHGVVLS